MRSSAKIFIVTLACGFSTAASAMSPLWALFYFAIAASVDPVDSKKCFDLNTPIGLPEGIVPGDRRVPALPQPQELFPEQNDVAGIFLASNSSQPTLALRLQNPVLVDHPDLDALDFVTYFDKNSLSDVKKGSFLYNCYFLLSKICCRDSADLEPVSKLQLFSDRLTPSQHKIILNFIFTLGKETPGLSLKKQFNPKWPPKPGVKKEVFLQAMTGRTPCKIKFRHGALPKIAHSERFSPGVEPLTGRFVFLKVPGKMPVVIGSVVNEDGEVGLLAPLRHEHSRALLKEILEESSSLEESSLEKFRSLLEDSSALEDI